MCNFSTNFQQVDANEQTHSIEMFVHVSYFSFLHVLSDLSSSVKQKVYTSIDDHLKQL